MPPMTPLMAVIFTVFGVPIVFLCGVFVHCASKMMKEEEENNEHL